MHAAEHKTSNRRRAVGYAALAAGVLTFVLISYLIHINRADLRAAIEAKAESHQVISAVRQIDSLVKEVETAQGKYLVTGDTVYLSAFTDLSTKTRQALEDLRAIVANDPDQLGDARELGNMVRQRLTLADQAVQLRNNARPEPEESLSRQGLTLDLMDRIHSRISAIIAREDRRWENRSFRLLADYERTSYWFTGGLVMSLLLVGIAALLLTLESREKHRAQEALRLMNEQLERRVEERTADLAAANDRLRLSEEKYSTTLFSIGDAVIATDVQSHITFMNPAAERLTGWKSDQATGKRINQVFRIIHEMTREAAGSPVDAVLDGAATAGLPQHTLLLARDDRELAIDDSAAPIRNSNGEIVGVVLIFRDVTAERKAQDAIRRQAELISISPDAMFVRGIDGTISFWSDGATRLYGWSAEEALGRTTHQLLKTVHPVPLDRLNERLRVTGRWEGELLHTRKDGTTVTVYSRWLAQRDQAGSPAEIFESNVDISERKRMEDEVRGIALFPEQSPNPVLRISADGAVLYANPPGAHMLNEALAVDRAPKQWMAIAARARRESAAIQEEMQFGDRKFAVLFVPFPDRDYVNLYGTDVTERAQKAEQLRKLNRTLRAISNSNQALMHATDESKFLKEVCDIVVNDCGHAMVWIGLAENDEMKSVQPVAWAGFEEGYLQALNITWADTERGRGPTGIAIRTGQACVCNNTMTDPNFAPWRKRALERGYASTLAVPLISDGKAFGALMIYSRQPDAFSPEEVHLLNELAGDLAYGITFLRLRAAKLWAEQALRESEERLSLAVDGAGMATWDVDVRTGRAVWSRRNFELLGYPVSPAGDATLQMWRACVHPEDLDEVLSALEHARQEHGLFCPEHRIIRADTGQIRWLRVFGRFSYNNSGEAVRFSGVSFDNTQSQQVAHLMEAGFSTKPDLIRAHAAPLPAASIHPTAAAPVDAGPRDSGIEVIGKVPWGTHFCEFYRTREDLIDTLVPYFREGLAANEFCMWITSAPLERKKAIAALRKEVPGLNSCIKKGQIEFLDYTEWYTPGGKFDPELVLRGWNEKLATALSNGYEGLRLTGNTFWLEKTDWSEFARYEETVNQIINGQRMLALCTYSLEKCRPSDIFDVIANHQFALINNAGQWEILKGTGQLTAERALRESEERLRLVIWASDLGVLEWELSSDRAMLLNPRAYEMLGYNEEQVTGMAEFVKLVIHPEDANRFHAALADARMPGHLFNTVCRVLRRTDGEPRWIEFSGRFERSSDGQPVRLIAVAADMTDQKRAQEAVKESENRYRALFDMMSSGFAVHEIICDKRGRPVDYRFLQTNESFERLTGLKGADIVGKTVKQIIPDIEDLWIERYGEVALTGKPAGFESYARPLKRFFEVTAYSPAPGQFATIFQDITDRKRGEEELRKFHRAVEQSPASIVITDTAGSIQYVNPRFTEVTGYTAEEAIGQNSRILNSGMNNPALFQQLWQAITSGREWHGEFCNRKKNGELYWEIALISPIKTADGVTTHYLAVNEDITARKQMEDALRSGEERLRLALWGAEQGTWDWDLSERVIHWDTRSREILGLASEGPIPYESFLETLYPDDRQRIFEAGAQALRKHSGLDEEYRTVRPDGSIRWVLSRGRGFYDSAGKPYRMSGTMLDITEKKTAEEQLRAAIQEKEVLLKELYHRTKNNMSVISSLMGLQASYCRDETVREVFQETRSRIQAMALVHEKLYRSRNLSRLNTRDYLGDLASSVLKSNKASSQRIALGLDLEEIEVDIDTAIPCGLVLNELVSNSLKHAFPHQRPGHIDIRLRAKEGKKELIYADDGIGLPDNINIADSQSLGLKLIYTLVTKQLNGSLEIGTGHGTQFSILF